MKNELLGNLTEEQIAKVEKCKNSDELLKLAQKEGVMLTDEQLEAVSGGCGGGDNNDNNKDDDKTNKRIDR